jgi:adenylate cyclase
VTDIFISYARSTVREAERIAEALQALGYGVWRDDALPAHRAYSDVIEERLKAAKAVVVIWSADAAASEWVRSEANRAREDRKLVQLSLDGAPLPMPFDQIQCADLAGWAGDADAPGWRTVVASIADLVGSGPGPARPGPPARRVGGPSVCVLPFVNMSGEGEQDYFSDGISEDIITDLSKVSALTVTSRNSAFQFKGKNVDVRQIARTLGVSHVLEGSVRRAGNRVRITAQLIEGATDSHVWAERFDRDLTDIFALQDEISRAIVAALRLKLLPAEKSAIERRGTSNAEAYDLYLRARKIWVSGDNGLEGLQEVERLCVRATALDQAYAEAWVIMAFALCQIRYRFGVGDDDGMAAAERALAINPDLADGHAVRARLLCLGQSDFAEAMAELDTALRLDPQSYEANNNAGYIYFRQERFAEAARFYEKACLLDESAFGPPAMLSSCYGAMGDEGGTRRAERMVLERAQKALAEDPNNGEAMGHGAGALAALGDTALLRDWVGRALRLAGASHSMRYNLICALCRNPETLGDAVALLEPYLRDVTRNGLVHLLMDPDVASIRERPDVAVMLKAAKARVGVGP